MIRIEPSAKGSSESSFSLASLFSIQTKKEKKIVTTLRLTVGGGNLTLVTLSMDVKKMSQKMEQ